MGNEAFGRRMRAFTMSYRVVKSVNMFMTYKILRFISHGILNRQKEGQRRRKKAEVLGQGFLNPPNIDELDPEGHYLTELADLRCTVVEFFEKFSSRYGAHFCPPPSSFLLEPLK